MLQNIQDGNSIMVMVWFTPLLHTYTVYLYIIYNLYLYLYDNDNLILMIYPEQSYIPPEETIIPSGLQALYTRKQNYRSGLR